MKLSEITSNSDAETKEAGSKFAERLKPGDVVAFYGDLGAGKTEFIKGVCDYFEVDEIVNSPTFTIINRYKTEKFFNDTQIFHIDLYRIKEEKELQEIGFEDCIYSDEDIKLIEWAEKAEDHLKILNYKITILNDEESEDKRLITIEQIEKHMFK